MNEFLKKQVEFAEKLMKEEISGEIQKITEQERMENEERARKAANDFKKLTIKQKQIGIRYNSMLH